MMIGSTIVVSQDLDFAKKNILDSIDSKLIKIYFADELERSGEFKVELAKEVIREAYITEEHPKYLILCALNYNIIVQNSLLKLLEEPPRNIIFILIVKSNTALLPTIRSRLNITHLKSQKEPYELGLNLKNLSLNDIFLFLKKHKNSSRDEVKEIIQTLLKELIMVDSIKLRASELDMFDKSIELSQLNSRPQNILSILLLTIHQAQGRKR
ncbi:MAG TPA: DNA polymerase III subunit delta' [Campylobacterales bacterium]|nr:DNA polymerase III subunit delta' [Campylobacterales bacterium]